MRWIVLSTLVACEGFEVGEKNSIGGIQAVGDSFLDWNVESGESIPEVVADLLDSNVQNNAISGALFSSPNDEDIRVQYESNGNEWVVMTAGGNDLNEECGCGDCSDNLTQMISGDGSSGDLPDFIYEMIEDGPNVIMLGYHSIPEDAEEFGNCNDELDVLATRLEALASQEDSFLFLDGRDFVSPESTPEAYDEDLIHPSVEGGRILGQALADTITDYE